MTARHGERLVLGRRAVAAAGVLGLGLAACHSAAPESPRVAGSSGTPSGQASPDSADPDRRVLLDALSVESRMQERVGVAVQGHQSVGPLGAALRVHQRHVDLLASALGGDGSATAEPQPGQSETPGSTGPESTSREDPSTPATLPALARDERDLARRHAGLALGAESGQVARLLGSLSAAAAQQAQVLGSTSPRQRTRR